VAFTELFETGLTRIGLIFNFLAILEMLALGQLGIQLGEGFNNFWITNPSETAPVIETDVN
jgi:segregation and condensation protein A